MIIINDWDVGNSRLIHGYVFLASVTIQLSRSTTDDTYGIHRFVKASVNLTNMSISNSLNRHDNGYYASRFDDCLNNSIS